MQRFTDIVYLDGKEIRRLMKSNRRCMIICVFLKKHSKACLSSLTLCLKTSFIHHHWIKVREILAFVRHTWVIGSFFAKHTSRDVKCSLDK